MGEQTGLVGQRFGEWTVLARNGSLGKVSAWECRCSCGTVKTLRSDRLRAGRTKSCGCLQAIAAEERGRPFAFDSAGRRLSRVAALEPGLRVSRLTLEDPIPDDTLLPREQLWVCKCKCGNVVQVPAARLAYRQTKSCGCLAVEHWRRELKKAEDRLALAVEALERVERAQPLWS